MKVFILLLLFAFNVKSEDVMLSPVEVKFFSFCTLKGKCSASITLINETALSVKIESDWIGRTGVSNCAIKVYEGRGFIEAVSNNENTYEHKVKVRCNFDEKFSNPLLLSPYEKVSIDIDDLNSVFELDVEQEYVVSFYASLTRFFINDEFIGDFVLGSNYSLVAVPEPMGSESFKK